MPLGVLIDRVRCRCRSAGFDVGERHGAGIEFETPCEFRLGWGQLARMSRSGPSPAPLPTSQGTARSAREEGRFAAEARDGADFDSSGSGFARSGRWGHTGHRLGG